MKLDITPVLSGKIKVMPFEFAIDPDGDESPAPPYGITLKSDVRVSGKITDSGSCLFLKLTAEADYDALCDRCADEISGTVSTDIDRMIAESGVLVGDAGDEYVVVGDGVIDLDADIIEELMLSFPSQLLCRPDCKGICPECGQNFNRGDCECRNKQEIDPRWASLAKLLEQNDENKK